jgi:hypothetical protein
MGARTARLGSRQVNEMDRAEMFPPFIETSRHLGEQRCALRNSR